MSPKDTSVDSGVTAEQKAILLEEAVPLVQGKSMSRHTDKMSVTDMVDAWMVLDMIEDHIHRKKEQYRAHLLALIEEKGEVDTDSGRTFTIQVGSSRIERQCRQTKEPDKDAMLALVAQRGLKLEEVYDEVKTLVYNHSKVSYLIDTGKLSAAEVDDLKKVSWALSVKKPKSLVDLFEKVKTGRWPATAEAKTPARPVERINTPRRSPRSMTR